MRRPLAEYARTKLVACACACACGLAVVAACYSAPTSNDAGADGLDAGDTDDGAIVIADADRPASCPSDLPASCPSTVPSYATDIGPFIARTCFPCHTTGGTAVAKHDFLTYAQVYKQRSAVLNQFYACSMPPADAGVVVSAQDRATLLAWLVCHAPNN